MNRQTFEGAVKLLSEQDEMLNELKQYYRMILTHPFEEVLNRNRFLDVEQEKDILHKRDLLPSIVDFLIQKEPSTELGIVDGIMNEVLFFFHYARFTKDDRWEKYAHTLLDKVLISLDTQSLPIDFKDGVCGIGWGLIYLVQKGFLNAGSIEKALYTIDCVLSDIDIDEIDTSSFSHGIGGIMLYWVTRILYMNKQGKEILLDQQYIDNISVKAEEVLQQSNNIFIVNAASQFQYIVEHSTELDSLQYTPSIRDWTNFPTFLAKNPQYWKPGIMGCPGIGLLTMLVLNFNK
ncbi:lanthionine synthetase LanC family protein [uncultured Bacteroides sp.]|uniref:lanthionine synthetase LanC family protein n=1 Tax=uncultured Bacteroides sp. TaxID=162156 RepID=UPI0025FB5A3F|nr:lanthionine synthetase LanC family protein [uncultured Bacteroides sp.]